MTITIRPTSADVKIARSISRHTNRRTERFAAFLTWGADEHVMCAAAALWWLCSRQQAHRRVTADHVLLTTVAATILPHVLKGIFNQRRPDRMTVIGHLHGIPVSGKPLDAFPSGHAIHVGVLTSAASELPRPMRFAVWGAGGALLLTRIVLLAHWTSDVALGLAIGTGLERSLRVVTGFGKKSTA
jgi:undecaprenyl-diphosphatase